MRISPALGSRSCARAAASSDATEPSTANSTLPTIAFALPPGERYPVQPKGSVGEGRSGDDDRGYIRYVISVTLPNARALSFAGLRIFTYPRPVSIRPISRSLANCLLTA